MTKTYSMEMIKGSCLCGRCGYEAEEAFFEVLHCHCSICRKIHGAAFATYGGVSVDTFKWVCDLDNLKIFQSSTRVTRYFCHSCGSLLASKDQSQANIIYLSLGGVDSTIQVSPEYHQFVAFKADWHEIDDDLPQFPGEYVD